MKAIHIVLGTLLLPVIPLAQAEGQEPNSSSASDTSLAAEVQVLRDALSQTQKQLARQQLEIQTLKAQSQAAPATDNQGPVETEPRTYDLASHELAETGGHGTLNVDQQPSAQQGQLTGKAE